MCAIFLLRKKSKVKESNSPRVNDSQRTTYTVSLFRFNLKAMTGVVVVMMVEMDASSFSSPLSRSIPTDFLHRKMHGQQRRRTSAILRSAASSVVAVPVMAVPFSSFTSLGHVQDLKIIVVGFFIAFAEEFSDVTVKRVSTTTNRSRCATISYLARFSFELS